MIQWFQQLSSQEMLVYTNWSLQALFRALIICICNTTRINNLSKFVRRRLFKIPWCFTTEIKAPWFVWKQKMKTTINISIIILQLDCKTIIIWLTYNTFAVLFWTVSELSIYRRHSVNIHQYVSFCVPQKKQSNSGLEWVFHFWLNYPFKSCPPACKHFNVYLNSYWN